MDKNEKLLKLKELTDQFHDNIKQYKSDMYDEANTRVDFIDKFFEILDWDVRNLQGYSEHYREVVREDKIQIEGKQKAPDYSFRIGGVRKFFVEAKKPSVNIKEDISPAFQVRRYGYTAKLPLSILTDFEEFSIYDTRIKPDKNDKASVGRVFYCTFEEYEKHFEFIYNTFSKSAILKGSFDNYIEENKNKKGTGEVDKELLKLVEDWRTELAKNIALRNNEIDIYNLNNAVQKIIDRIIFLRIAEDKEIEPYEQLLKITKTGDIENKGLKPLVYQSLNELFVNANKKYNAGLFKPESWLTDIKIDDKALIYIIKGLYYPECPYEFSILPIEILGNIYEQFLGKTIRFRNVKEGHAAIIEEKPEVRKAGGVYYTPQYIVNYIVENTIGEKIAPSGSPLSKGSGLTPDEISTLKICDPACGSGSFLVGAYQYLLNYHIDYYTNPHSQENKGLQPLVTQEQKERWIKKWLKEGKIYQVSSPKSPFDEGGRGDYKLTIEEKQKILINNIHGVDIDPQAVEVTKLSLYLKLLENEGKEAEGFLFKHSDIKLLPTLDKNIKCGNSLIGSDFYTSQITPDLSRGLFPDLETMRKVNVFDWEKEFPEIFGGKGKQTTENTKNTEGGEKESLTRSVGGAEEERRGFDVAIGNPPWVQSKAFEEDYKRYYSKRYKTTSKQYDLFCLFTEKSIEILNKNGIHSFIIPSRFFTNEDYYNYRKFILYYSGIKEIFDVGEHIFQKVEMPSCIYILTKEKENIIKLKYISGHYLDNRISENSVNLQDILEDKNLFFKVSSDNAFFSICQKIQKNGTELLNFVTNARGVEIGKDSEVILRVENENPFLIGENVSRYNISFTDLYINANNKNIDYKTKELYTGEKILLRKTGHGINATLDIDNYWVIQVIYIFKKRENIPENIRYILAIINSKVIYHYYYEIFGEKNKKVFPHFRQTQFLQLPIRKIDFSNPIEKGRHDQLVSLVDQMLEAQKLSHNPKSESDKKIYAQKIEMIDNRIDRLVYELYGLTEEEIKIAEGGRRCE